MAYYAIPLPQEDVERIYSGEDVPQGRMLLLTFETNGDEANDWLTYMYFGVDEWGDREAPDTGREAVPGDVEERPAVCNTGAHPIRAYLYMDVQAGGGGAWTTSPPIPVHSV